MGAGQKLEMITTDWHIAFGGIYIFSSDLDAR